ncbi:MAG: tyrosine--tRNA ligase [Candidatus Aenigmatarchaeota archaeon]
MDLEEKIELVKKNPTEEILTEEDLKNLLETNEHPEHYIGFEISGKLHLGTLLICGIKINDFSKAGIKCKVFLADWHTFLNKKLGGNWDNIIKAYKYYEEAFKFFCPDAKIILGSELYFNNNEYWKDVVRFSSLVTLPRLMRTLTIMGRSEKEKLFASQMIYPPMQAVDVKYLCQIAHGGTDQRKVHVLCREIFPKLGWEKPIAVHHHLLAGLEKPPEIKDKFEKVEAAKMSKSKPWTCIFIHDNEEEIKEKLMKAWCPEGIIDGNPVLEIAQYIIFRMKKRFEIERKGKYNDTLEFFEYKELEEFYKQKKIHPLDLKESVARVLSEILKPIREHFEKPKNKKLLEIFEKLKEDNL